MIKLLFYHKEEEDLKDNFVETTEGKMEDKWEREYIELLNLKSYYDGSKVFIVDSVERAL